eukprot:scaffold10649_cov214-Ochromonas_danica.AAC.4
MMQGQRQSAATRVEDDVPTFRLVTELQSAGVNVSDIKKLQEAGYVTIGSVLQCATRDLLAIKGLTEARVEKIREAAKKLDCRGNSFKTGLEVKERRKNIIHITTGSTALDKILGGGIETASITELFGEFRTGKTQLAHTLCVTSQLSFDMNGGQGKVIYLDTEGNFRPERIESIADRFGLDAEQTLDNIIICRVFSHEEQMGQSALLSQVEFSGRGELSERQQKLGQHLSHLVRVAEEFNIAIVVINQCMADPGALSMFGPVIKPVGGHVLAHASTTRVMLKKGKGEQRIAKIFDSPLMPEEEAVMQIANGGIEDVN